MPIFQSWLIRAVALLVAWGFLLMLAAIVGTIIGVRIWPFLVLWVWFGLLAMLYKPDNHPLPDDKVVDVMGALAMLWWAAKWPLRLLKK